MSFTLIARVMTTKVGSPIKKIILIKLADQSCDRGISWPSYETIATACEVSRRSVIDHIKELEKQGFLRIEKRYDHGAGKNFSNRYHLTLEGDSENPALVQMSAKGSERPALGSERAAPEPINEPTNETINKHIEEKEKEKPKSKNAKEAKFDTSCFLTPSFIDKDTWQAYHDMREVKKRPATEHACQLLVKKLTAFHEKGLDVNLIMENSIFNNWLDVFEPKQNQIATIKNKGVKDGQNRQSANQPSAAADQQISAVQAEIQRLRAERDSQSGDAIRTVS